jgi:pimeloyl-ACP methyl ester carboxylesterase
VPDVALNGAKIWYEVKGAGEYVLQIGGAGFAHENFGAVTEAFQKNFAVIDFDLRGYGNSDRPDQHYDMEVWADDCAALLEAVGVERAHVHGTSMGGMVAIKLAAKYPEKVAALVLGCSAAKSDTLSRYRWEIWKALAQAYGMASRELAIEIACGALSRRFLDTPQGEETVRTIQGVLDRNCPLETFVAACDAMVTADLMDDCRKIAAPTLVMDGDEDVLTPLTQGPQGAGSRLIAELIPNARLHVITGVAHTNLMEVPDLSVEIVSEFFREAGVAAARTQV